MTPVKEIIKEQEKFNKILQDAFNEFLANTGAYISKVNIENLYYFGKYNSSKIIGTEFKISEMRYNE